MRLIAVAAVLCSACSGSSSTAPAPTPTPTPSPAVATVTGHVTAVNGGQPLSGVTAALGPATGTTDGGGVFTASVPPTPGSYLLTLSGTTILSRSLFARVPSARSLDVDAIALGDGFDQTFYREIVRNGFEGGNELLRRWTRNPSVYIQTTNTDTRTADMVEAVARDVVPRWTNGTFAVTTVERGPETREGQAGWLTIKWTAEDIGHCATSQVGGGLIQFSTTRQCGCAGFQQYPTLVRHELGHAMGFWHTDGIGDVMHATVNQCDAPIAARELYHAAIAYRRPVGNTDPDTDPSSVVNLAPMRAIP